MRVLFYSTVQRWLHGLQRADKLLLHDTRSGNALDAGGVRRLWQVIELQYGWLKLLLAACDNRRRFGRVALDASECVFPCRRKVHALSSSDRLSAVHPILSLSLYTVSTLLLSFPLLLFLCLSLFLSLPLLPCLPGERVDKSPSHGTCEWRLMKNIRSRNRTKMSEGSKSAQELLSSKKHKHPLTKFQREEQTFKTCLPSHAESAQQMEKLSIGSSPLPSLQTKSHPS